MLTELILVGLDGYFWIYLPRNTIKHDRSCILRACFLYISHLLEILLAELTIVNRSFLFILWVCNGDEIPNYISDHMLTALILVGPDGYLWLSLSKNPIKLDIACILRACLLFISRLLRFCWWN